MAVEREVANYYAHGALIEAINLTTGQSSWFVYQPIAVTGWSMVVVRIKDEIQIEPQFTRRRVIWACVSAILGLTCLAVWFGAGWYERRLRLPYGSIEATDISGA